MQSCKNEDSCLTYTRFSLADDVHTEDGLWNALVLNFRWVFKPAVHDGAETFRLQDEILETRCMNANVVAPVMITNSENGKDGV